MPYEITIKKSVVKQMPADSNYQKISDTGGEDGGPKYGYVTEPAYDRLTDEVAFQQRVEELNILDVVAAINGIKLP